MFRNTLILMLITAIVVIAKKHTTPKPPKECPKNEVWSWCGHVCEPTCGILQPGWTVCPNFTCTDKTGDCRCCPGLVRDENNVCIELENCKNRQ
ncbi:venom serine protease inhibitor-like [Nomia melanderi]|uniref:venom serine protease inhibitor-like n=1 Tax=Nomia melanderi TaxID=2448451 RepID=UPI0013041C90|nr:venom serine protease inhibitor-like [Nomia melanderi]